MLALSPMLWENTVRFHVMSSSLAAVALSRFVVLSLLLSWKAVPCAIRWLAASAGAITARVLSSGTYDLLLFVEPCWGGGYARSCGFFKTAGWGQGALSAWQLGQIRKSPVCSIVDVSYSRDRRD